MKLKPAGKVALALLILTPAGAITYFNYLQPTVKAGAEADKAEMAHAAGSTAKPNAAQVAAGAGGEIKEVKVTKTDRITGKPVTVIRKEKVYNVCLSQWPGHMAGIIACGGLKTQPGSFCSSVRSSYGDAPGIQLQFKFIEDPVAKNGALIKGGCDFVWQTVDEMPLNMSAFKKAGTDVQAFVQIDWSRGGDACVAANGIKTPTDLHVNGKGAAVMSFTPDHTLLEFWITNSKLTPQEVQQLRAKTRRHDTDPTFGASLFIQKKVDVACLWEPDVSNALHKRPGSYRVFSTKQADTLIADVLLARSAFLNKHPAVAEKVARVFMEGARIGEKDKDAAARLVSTVVPRFRDELGYAGTRKAFDWVVWNGLGDNAAMFGLANQDPQFDAVYTQAEAIWSEYKDPQTGDPVLSARYMPHTLRNRSIIARIYNEAKAEADRQAKSTGAQAKAIEPAKPTYDPEVARKGAATLTRSVTINFDTGAFSLDPGARQILKREVLSQLKLAQSMSVRIEGNTDDVGSAKTNKRISGLRAKSVADYLISQGIVAERIAARGNGEDNPLCNAKTPNCRAQNRRTDIVLISASN